MDKFLSREMYKENILENYRHPLNFGKLKKPDIEITESNPLCGDIITIDISIKNKKIKDIKFTGKGCAISIASASLLTESIKNMPLDKVKKLNENHIKHMLKIPVSQPRIKCAMIPLKAIQKALENENT